MGTIFMFKIIIIAMKNFIDLCISATINIYLVNCLAQLTYTGFNYFIPIRFSKSNQFQNKHLNNVSVTIINTNF